MNAIENRWINKNIKLFKGKCNKCGKYGHRVSDCWGNKKDNRNKNNTARNPSFNGECNNCRKRGHRAVDCWDKKRKEKDNGVNNLFVGDNFCGELQEENNEEDPEEWLCNSGASSLITHNKKDMTDVEKCDINVTVVNDQNMKCDIKGSINTKI